MRLIYCSLRLNDHLLLVFALASLCRHSSSDQKFASRPTPSYSLNNSSSCRCFPGDPGWPADTEWDDFNRTLGGKLIATVPIASACHHDSFTPYDAEACAKLRSVWFTGYPHYESSSSVMAPFFANQSCDPFLPESARCVLGSYVSYAVNASQASDYQTVIDFVQRRNIRLTVRNTGHDYNAKSSGAGAIAIWTHHIKSIEILDYNSTNYTGKAMKMGAGVQAIEAYEAAHAQGLVVVGGHCPTVGIAGGYTQGGGHGPLASKFGLGADQVLEWEVITASKEHLRVTPSQNPDLYWALSGGGGGTFGVVLSVTTKAYKDMPSSASNLTFTNHGVSQEAYYDVIETFHDTLVPLVDAGGVSIWQFTNTTFSMTPTYGPNISKAQMDSILKPVKDKLDQHQLNYTYVVNEYPTFLDSYNAMSPPIPTSDLQIGGRWISRLLVQHNNSALTAAFRTINDKGGGATGLALNVSNPTTVSLYNSVNPGWRDTLFDVVVYTLYNYTDWQVDLANQELITNDLVPELERLTPGGGAYLSEADFQQPNFQQTFYGVNYGRLNAIKDTYDPTHMFYALTGVGSEHWSVAEDGRLCRSASF